MLASSPRRTGFSRESGISIETDAEDVLSESGKFLEAGVTRLEERVYRVSTQ